ncbi:phosphohydrolase [Aliivibrio fischeri]|uniref:bifunctional NUDIX hydrolase/phosphatase PAP2 family protein n=1 Tax=Aliivibrio fischeri TaxID=668 RepID=UPI00080E277E|nr:phosphatase PAP2 family protein [Aliivibrio fischeri]OCH09720.1 phosphohydrolase [Aliivibrio fischeri]OCH30016.1 phosphohydrolase [Aliivibrio fischeri]OCH36771.1 phosphohydrolase [Aliivibrio fischeri]
MKMPLFNIFVFILSLFSMHSASANIVQPKGAVCVIGDGSHVVLVEELITGKLSLPGGTIDKDRGETPQEAAEREVWEETGLVVTAKELLIEDETAAIFRCVSESDIVAFDLETINGLFRIPSWFAPHYGIETEAVYLSEVYKIPEHKYRYPGQLPLLQQWSLDTASAENKILWVTNLVDQAPKVHQFELDLLSSLRAKIDQLPQVVTLSVKTIFTLINETGKEGFFYFFVIIALVYFGRNSALTLLFGIILSIVLTGLAKQGLGLPRPFVYIPQLQLTEAVGFGMPSMHSMLSVVIYGTFYLILKRLPLSEKILKRYACIFIILIIGQSIARVWLGVHFVSDAIVGLCLGGMVFYHFSNMQKKHGDLLYKVIGGLHFWLLLSVVISGIAFVMAYVNYLYAAAICWGVVAAIMCSKPKVITDVKVKLVTLITIVLSVMLARYGVSYLLTQVEASSLNVLVIRTIGNFTVIFGLFVYAAWLPKVIENKFVKR